MVILQDIFWRCQITSRIITGSGYDVTGSGDDVTGSGDASTGSGDDVTGSGDDVTGKWCLRDDWALGSQLVFSQGL